MPEMEAPRGSATERRGPTDDLLELGEEYAAARDMGTLEADERLPFGYFNPLRESGRIDVRGEAREAIRREEPHR
jgi:hypothetical protein